MSTERKSVYKRGADDGFYFGVYLVVLFFASVFAMTLPFAGLLTMILMLGVPFVIYRFLRRTYVADNGMTQYSALWLQGIIIFFCGSLLSGLVAYVYMRWINPDFIMSIVKDAIGIYSSSNWENGQEVADVLQKMIDQKLVPKPIEVVIQSIWTAVFTGSLLSMLVALVVQSKKIKPSEITKKQ